MFEKLVGLRVLALRSNSRKNYFVSNFLRVNRQIDSNIPFTSLTYKKPNSLGQNGFH
jgi:hypothetical protein